MRLPFMISCRKAAELTEKDLAGELGLLGRMQLKIHRQMCDACRRYGWQTKEIDELLRKHTTSYREQSEKQVSDVPKELEERIKDKLDNV